MRDNQSKAGTAEEVVQMGSWREVSAINNRPPRLKADVEAVAIVGGMLRSIGNALTTASPTRGNVCFGKRGREEAQFLCE